MLTLDKFEEASEIVQKVILPTNLIYSEYYSAQTGGKIYLKPENMQYTGAYKIRGAYYKHAAGRRAAARIDNRVGRQPCAGRCLCRKVIRRESSYCHAQYDASNQGEPHKGLRR